MEMALLSLLAPGDSAGAYKLKSAMSSKDPDASFQRWMEPRNAAEYSQSRNISASTSSSANQATTNTLEAVNGSATVTLNDSSDSIYTSVPNTQKTGALMLQTEHLHPSAFPIDSESVFALMQQQMQAMAGLQSENGQKNLQQAIGLEDLDIMQLADMFNPTVADSLAKLMPQWQEGGADVSIAMLEITKITVSINIVMPRAAAEALQLQNVAGENGEVSPEFVVVHSVQQMLTSVQIRALDPESLTAMLPENASLSDVMALLSQGDGEANPMRELLKRLIGDDIEGENLFDITTEEGFTLARKLMDLGALPGHLQQEVMQWADAVGGVPISNASLLWPQESVSFIPNLDAQELADLSSAMAVYAEVPWSQQPMLITRWQAEVNVALKELGQAAQGGDLKEMMNAALKQAMQEMDAVAGANSDSDPADSLEFDALIQKVMDGEVKPSSHFAADAFTRQIASAADKQLLHEQLMTGLKETATEAAGAAKESIAQGLQATSMQQTHLNSASDRSISFLKADAPLFDASNTATEQVELTISKAMKSGADRVVIQLDPAELGRVEVRLDVSHDGRTHVVVTASKQETLDQLQRDARQLQNALQDAGLETSSQDMAFNLQGGDKEDNADGVKQAFSEVKEDNEDPQLLLDPMTGHYTLNLETGLNIKV